MEQNNISEDIETLELEEKRLKEMMDRIQFAKRTAIEKNRLAEVERQRLLDLEKVFTINVVALSGAMVIIEAPFRNDIVELLRTIPGRTYRGQKENMIPLKVWNDFLEGVQKLPKIEIVFTPSATKDIESYLNTPIWLVELGPRSFIVTKGPQAAYDIHKISSANFDSRIGKWTVPFLEGWKLFEVFSKVEGVVWTDEASDFIKNQMERRASLDSVAKLERGIKYLDFDMNGVKLRPFQEVGCEFIDTAEGNVLLADEMGLGKTIQSVAYGIKNNFRTIVICPATLIPNWARQIKKLTGKAPAILSGSDPTKFDMLKQLTDPAKWTIINYDIAGKKSEVKLVTKDQEGFDHEEYQIRFLWIELLNMSKPDLIIVDEGHYIKNVDSNRSQGIRKLKCPRFLMMTGTPVLNRPGELWPMLTMIAPDTFPNYDTFINQYTYDKKGARNVEELRMLLRSIMIRRLKKDVVADLPPINRIEDYHELTPKALKIYRKIEQGIYTTLSEYSARGTGGEDRLITSVLAQIQRLKMVCAINKVDYTADKATELYDQTDETENRKVLIFSQYKAVAYAIHQRLADQGSLCFVSRGRHDFITADNQERDRMVQQFQTDPNIRYLVVTEKTAKEGHDITAAGNVIFNDLFWTPAAHEQGEGRAYGRLDNPHTIGSYYMITDMDGDSIEEWIMDMLEMKKNIIEEVVEGVEKSRDVSIAMALIAKMKEKMWRK